MCIFLRLDLSIYFCIYYIGHDRQLQETVFAQKYFIGSVECATMGKCKNQEIKNAVSVTCLVALVLVCVGIYIVNCGKEKV